MRPTADKDKSVVSIETIWSWFFRLWKRVCGMLRLGSRVIAGRTVKHLHGCHGAIDQFDEVAVSRAAHQKPRFIEWRRHKRSIIIEPVFVRTSWCEMRGCMTNLSARGAAIEITGGSMPAQGEDIALILQDKMYLWGTTLRVDQGIVAMQFPSGFEEIGDVLSIELRGIDIYRNSWR